MSDSQQFGEGVVIAAEDEAGLRAREPMYCRMAPVMPPTRYHGDPAVVGARDYRRREHPNHVARISAPVIFDSRSCVKGISPPRFGISEQHLWVLAYISYRCSCKGREEPSW